jgi:hypothetical protein
MSQTLEGLFSELVGNLPFDSKEEFVLSAENLPELPAGLQTDQLVIQKSGHGYHAYTQSYADMLIFHAHKRIYRMLGLLLLAKVFHNGPREVHIQLTHPESHIKLLILDYKPGEEWDIVRGYRTLSSQLTFWHEKVNRHPFDDNIPVDALPLFNLTNKQNIASEHDWEKRDTVRCAGSRHGNVLFANLLLNLSVEEETCDEVDLEGEMGFRGVGRGSPEVTLLLPDSAGWGYFW